MTKDWRQYIGQECEGIGAPWGRAPGATLRGELSAGYWSRDETRPCIGPVDGVRCYVKPDSIRPLSPPSEVVGEAWEPATIDDATHVLVGTSYLRFDHPGQANAIVDVNDTKMYARELADLGCTLWKRPRPKTVKVWEEKIECGPGYNFVRLVYDHSQSGKHVLVVPREAVHEFTLKPDDQYVGVLNGEGSWTQMSGIDKLHPGDRLFVVREAE